MKQIFLIILLIITVNSITVYSQWTIYQTSTTSHLYKIQFINENTGFTAGGSELYNDSAVFFKTTNAGQNWVKYRVYDSTSIPLKEIYGLYFINENTGFVSGRYLNIYKTSNGGYNWVAIIPPYYSLTQIYNALYFINENTGYAAGRYGYVCKTTNSGLNWELIADLDGNLHGVYFVNQNTGFFSSASGGVYKTTNSGQNFSFYYLGDFGFGSIRFISESTGYVVGYNAFDNSRIFRTTNNGQNWENILEYNEELYDVFFTNAYIGYTSGWNSILKTTNSGISWNEINKPENNGFLSIHFLNPYDGFITGGGGRIYRTTSGGVWINQISSEVPEGFKISNCYPNPFNSELKVQIAIMRTIINSDIFLEIYNILGNKVMEKKLEINNPGKYEIKLRFNDYTTGIYFIRIKSDYQITKPQKIIYLK
ncbi:MAG: T9SS type A sorting domain-containing protein [Ignavibacteria bacterium]|nr:T9SS type A sorting domain-containing protein [Ignavibacteria bacterium]